MLFVIILNRTILKSLGPLRRYRDHSKVRITHTGPVKRTRDCKVIRTVLVAINCCCGMPFLFVANKGNTFWSDRIKAKTLDALVANAWTNLQFCLRQDLVAALSCDLQIRTVAIRTEGDRLHYVKSSCLVIEQKSYSFLVGSRQA